MIKRLLIIHTILLCPLLFYNAIKWCEFNSLRKECLALALLQNQATSLSQIITSNLKTKEDYISGNTQYLYDEIESQHFSNNTQKIQLIESTLSENSFFVEKEEALAQPILIDLKDLRSILDKVEGTTLNKNKPHIFFQEFFIKKIKNAEDALYELKFKMIKREYL